jgi:hypothetical protein
MSPWKTFSSNLTRTLQDLATEGHFTDVTLVSDDQTQVQAHKLIIGAFSPVLKNLIQQNPHSQSLLYLCGVKLQELQAILKFMYFGEVTICKDCVSQFMELAKDLEMKELNQEEVIKHKYDCYENVFVTSTIDEHPELNHAEYNNVINDSEKYLQVKELECDETFENEENKSVDINTTVVSNKKSFDCKYCESVFTTRSGLIHHNKSKHEIGAIYPCD